MPYDIVYILSDRTNPNELIYSLRSVEKNFPYNRVWFAGGQPKGLTPDGRISHVQTGNSKWSRIRSSFVRAIECPEITDDFFLFNDDFFVMKKQKGEFINFVDGTLKERVGELKQPRLNPYGFTLFKAEQELLTLGRTTWNFDVHVPMLFNKELAKKNIGKCSSPQIRSVYGNLTGCPFVQHKDVKVYDLETVPKNSDYLSTNDEIFNHGKVGEYIRDKFNKPSRFEE